MSFQETPLEMPVVNETEVLTFAQEGSNTEAFTIDIIDVNRFLTDADYVQEISDLAQAMPKGPLKIAVYQHLEMLTFARVCVGVKTKLITAESV